MRNFSLIISLLFILSCSVEKIDSFDQPKGPDKAPGSWMYEMRAYPNGINKESKKRAEKQFLQMRRGGSRFDKLWTQQGPTNIAGRITDIALHPTDQNIIYAGSSVGGVWKSTDKGFNWELIFNEPGGLSVGNIGLSKSNPDILYVGTGEANGSATSGAFFGNGIYKSEDAGETWSNVGLDEADHTGRIVVHPENSEVAFVAATGTLYRKNTTRGIYKTTNGGDSWQNVLFVSDSTAAIDVAISETNPNVLFAAMWERTRFPEGRIYGGTTSGIYRSQDGGDSWELMTNGLPNNDPNIGRIGVTISNQNENIAYAVVAANPITNRFYGLYKTEDQGETWIQQDDDGLSGAFSSFGWFFGNVRVHPVTDEAIVVGFNNYTKVDSFWQVWSNGYHVDQHAFEFHPQDPNYVVFGNDGGIYISEDGGLTNRYVNTIPNTQFYEGKIHPSRTDTYLGGTQDNGTLITEAAGINGYQRILGGDGFVVQFDAIDDTKLYAESQWGNIALLEENGNGYSVTSITPSDSLAGRTNWNTPFVTIPETFGGIIYGGENVVQSYDFGQTWNIISPDLTNGPHGNSQSFGTITTLAISDIDQNIIVAGTDDSNVQVTTNNGASWSLVSQNLPNVSVSSVMTDPFDVNTIYVTFSGYRFSDYLPRVFKSEDLGETWIDISANLPEVPVNEILIDPLLESTYYLATDLGVFYTTNSGENWSILGDNLPPVIVNDLDLRADNRMLLAATYGRSLYTYELPSEVTQTTDLDVARLNVYPNPTADYIQVDIDKKIEISEVTILDQYGRLLGNYDYLPETIDVRSLSAGTYYIRLMNDEHIMTKSFAKIN